MGRVVRALIDNHVKLVVLGCAAGMIRNTYVNSRHRKNFKTIIEVLRLQDEMILDNHNRVISVTDHLTGFIDDICQREFDEQFISMINENYD